MKITYLILSVYAMIILLIGILFLVLQDPLAAKCRRVSRQLAVAEQEMGRSPAIDDCREQLLRAENWMRRSRLRRAEYRAATQAPLPPLAESLALRRLLTDSERLRREADSLLEEIRFALQMMGEGV